MKYQPGDAVGSYRVTGVIGEGATGIVYQVVNQVTGRLEAMKILADDYNHDLEQAQRFLREIQLQAKLDHPNIAQVRTAFCEGNTIVLVMELVDGESLSAILRRGPLSVTGSIRVAEQVLNALIMAHRHGIVHRDVKPANILVDRAGNVKLTDFGLAKRFGDPAQTNQGLAVGTVFYMAPEQVRGLEATDWRADLYAVGVLMYEMLTGRKPFDGAEHFTVMRAQIELIPAPVTHWAPHLPKAFDALLQRALQKDPAQRFQSASGFLTALQELPLNVPANTRAPWPYATYGAGLGALVLAAFAIPPISHLPPLEKLQLSMPAPPPAPAEAFRIPDVREEPPSVPTAVQTTAAQTTARPRPQPFTGTVHRATLPAASPRAAATETAGTIDPPPIKPPAAPAAALPAPPRIAINEPAPPAAMPAIQPELPAERPANWMRRNLGRVPKIFRRRDPKPEQKP